MSRECRQASPWVVEFDFVTEAAILHFLGQNEPCHRLRATLNGHLILEITSDYEFPEWVGPALISAYNMGEGMAGVRRHLT